MRPASALGQANSQDVLWVKSEYQATVFRFSAIRINNYYAITAGHGTYLPGLGIIKPLAVGTGTNFLTDPGTTSTIAEVIVYPTYPGSAAFTQPDLAVLKFSTPIRTGSNPVLGQANSLSVGDTLTSSGFGIPGFTGGSFNEDGSVRGWNAAIRSETGGVFNTDDFGNTRFSSASGVALNGRLSNGDSGSPVYDETGYLIGMNIGSNPSPISADPNGTTVFLDVTNPVIASWIETNTALPAALPDLRLAPPATAPPCA